MTQSFGRGTIFRSIVRCGKKTVSATEEKRLCCFSQKLQKYLNNE